MPKQRKEESAAANEFLKGFYKYFVIPELAEVFLLAGIKELEKLVERKLFPQYRLELLKETIGEIPGTEYKYVLRCLFLDEEIDDEKLLLIFMANKRISSLGKSGQMHQIIGGPLFRNLKLVLIAFATKDIVRITGCGNGLLESKSETDINKLRLQIDYFSELIEQAFNS